MKVPIRVNADYEYQLHGQPFQEKVSQAVEFLSFFLDADLIYSQKNYSADYLEYIQELTGKNIKCVSGGVAYSNWWGDLKNIELEKKINSKTELIKWLHQQGYQRETQIIRAKDGLNSEYEYPYILKSAWGMSGLGHYVVKEQDDLESAVKWMKRLHQEEDILVDPLLSRKWDFSIYVFSENKRIYYQNLVDNKFQYKGTILNNPSSLEMRDLEFSDRISKEQWEVYAQITDQTIQYILSLCFGNFGIDSFVFEKDGQFNLRAICEVNRRRTMGRIAYELTQKYFPDAMWSLFIIGKSMKNFGGFASIKRRLADLINRKKILPLSPGDSRFEFFLISASDPKEGKLIFEEVKGLLPECEFAVQI